MSGEIQVQGSASGRQKVATVDVSEDFKVHTFSFTDGSVLEFNIDAFPTHINEQNRSHGAVQKLRDSYAGVKGDAKLAYTNAKEVYDAMMNGSWSTRGESEGTGGQGAMYIEAISRLKGITLEVARGKVAKMSDEWKKAAQKDPEIVAEVAKIKLERAQAAVQALSAKTSDQPKLNLDDLDVAA